MSILVVSLSTVFIMFHKSRRLTISLGVLSTLSYVYANLEENGFPYDGVDDGQTGTIAQSLASNITGSTTYRSQLTKLFVRSNGWTAFEYIRYLINMALSFMSFIALIILIYTFFSIFFAKDDEGVKQAQKNLKGIAYAIGIIGLSWLIISLMFWVLSLV